jgi:ABC-type glycerol-3-phosphate transport system substrate-binding protein
LKKLLSILSVLIIMLAGCSSENISDNNQGESKEEILTINFWKPPHGPDKEIFAELISKFEEENPHIKVKHTIIPWDSVDQQYATTFAGSDPPDVVFMPDEWYPQYANGGALMDITDKFNEIEEGWHESTIKLGQYKGVQYGVPHIMATQAFIYNKDLLEAAGYSEPPKTLEELKTMATEISDETKNVYGLRDGMLGFSNQFWGPLFESKGVKLLNEDLTQVTFNTPKTVEVIDFIKELYDSGSTVPRNRFTGDQQNQQFISGNIAMGNLNYDVYASYMRENPKLNLGVSPPPSSSSGKNSQAVFFGFMFVAEKSKHKEEAWEFVKYLTNYENLEHYSQSVSMFSTRKDSSWWKDEPTAVPFAEAINNAFGATPTVHWREISRIIGEEIDFVLADRKTSQQALDEAEQAINEILDGN